MKNQWPQERLSCVPPKPSALALAHPSPPCDAVATARSGILGDNRDRTTIIASGALLWSLCTVGVSISTSLVQACCFTTLNGLGLALVIPCAQSLMADYFPAEQRGRAFGAMQLTMSFGSMVGSLVATNMASHEVSSARHPSHFLYCTAVPPRTPSHSWVCSASAGSRPTDACTWCMLRPGETRAC